MRCIERPTVAISAAVATILSLLSASTINPAMAHEHSFQGTTIAQFTQFAQSPTPVTYLTTIEWDPDQIVMQITEGEFRFHGYLERTTGNMFVGEDEQVRVMYDRDTGRIVVVNVQTGDEYYNYFFSEADEGAL